MFLKRKQYLKLNNLSEWLDENGKLDEEIEKSFWKIKNPEQDKSPQKMATSSKISTTL